MSPLSRMRGEASGLGLLYLGDQLVAYHCHHHSLFLDQTVVDALGGEGWGVRRQASFEACHALLASIFEHDATGTQSSRLALASELFEAMGQGKLTFELTAEGGIVRGEGLHYGVGYADKYGRKLKNRRPLDAFAAGYVAAAGSLAFPSDWGVLEAEETECVARGDARCSFMLTRRPEPPRFGVIVTRTAVEELPAANSPPLTARAERASAVAARILTTGSFEGLRTALVPMSYAQQVTFDTVHLIEKRSPELFPLVLTLIREAAQLGAFELLGRIVASQRFVEGHGPLARGMGERLEQLLGVVHALGWGAFEIAKFVPLASLILRTPLTHESGYYSIRHGATVRGRLFFQQGLALALMRLVHGVDFNSPKPLGPQTYQALVTGPERFEVHETRSPLRGDPLCEVTVERQKS